MIRIKALKSEKGFSLIEVLVSIALLGIVISGFSGALIGSSKAAMKTDQIDTARTLAQGQMEYIKNLPYAASYTPGDSSVYDSTNNKFIYYPGYSAVITAVNAAQRDANIQKITVTIKYNGVIAAALDDCKAN